MGFVFLTNSTTGGRRCGERPPHAGYRRHCARPSTLCAAGTMMSVLSCLVWSPRRKIQVDHTEEGAIQGHCARLSRGCGMRGARRGCEDASPANAHPWCSATRRTFFVASSMATALVSPGGLGVRSGRRARGEFSKMALGEGHLGRRWEGGEDCGDYPRGWAWDGMVLGYEGASETCRRDR